MQNERRVPGEVVPLQHDDPFDEQEAIQAIL